MYQKKADSLPLTSFDVSLKRPCFNPSEQANPLAHPAELNSKSTCKRDKVANRTYDPRYVMHEETMLSQKFNTQEWSVQQENGVSAYIELFTDWDKLYIDKRGFKAKNDRSLTFATRSTIPWKIECEENGYGRDNLIGGLNLKLDDALAKEMDTIALAF